VALYVRLRTDKRARHAYNKYWLMKLAVPRRARSSRALFRSAKAPTGVYVYLPQDVTIRRWAESENDIMHWTEFDHRGRIALLDEKGVQHIARPTVHGAAR
jgi:hypothetical protein